MGDLNLYATAMVLLFVFGYFLIAIEHITKINKAAIAVLLAILLWTIAFVDPNFSEAADIQMVTHEFADISQIIFFLLGALTIVEMISIHKGFQVIVEYVKTRSKRKLLWIVGILAFVLSAVLDNLTTTVVMVTLLDKLMNKTEDRLIIGGGIVIAANAGGAWTPIGDVTTTMLWIGGQLTTPAVIKDLLLPSLVCMLASFTCLTFMLKGEYNLKKASEADGKREPFSLLIFALGLGALLFTPIFKVITGLPPVMGILFGLSILWIVTDFIHEEIDNRSHLKVPYALGRVDLTSTFFFLGILLAVGALSNVGILEQFAVWITATVPNLSLIAFIMGIVSAIIDNVPLVAALMQMYSIEVYTTDSYLWELVAYCAGTGGSILIIGSAAGVVFMGIERVDFWWYMKKISGPALVGYCAGFLTYVMMNR